MTVCVGMPEVLAESTGSRMAGEVGLSTLMQRIQGHTWTCQSCRVAGLAGNTDMGHWHRTFSGDHYSYHRKPRITWNDWLIMAVLLIALAVAIIRSLS